MFLGACFLTDFYTIFIYDCLFLYDPLPPT